MKFLPNLFENNRAWAEKIKLEDPVGADRPSRAVELAAGAGAPPAFVVGMRMALQPGRGRTAAPVRSVMTSIALAVALVVATAGFAVDLQRLVSTPPLYGVSWDAAVGSTFGRIPDGARVPALGAAWRRRHRRSGARLADDRRQGRAGLGRGSGARHDLPHHRARPVAAERLRAGARAIHESTARAPGRRHGRSPTRPRALRR